MVVVMAKVNGHRVISAFYKRMTPQEAQKCHEPAAQHSESLNRFNRVLGAGRHIAARWRKQRRKPSLVSPQRPKCQSFHIYFSAIFLAITSNARLISSN